MSLQVSNEAKKKEPKVITARTFLQIARDFTRPLDALREAVSNSVDAKATKIYVKVWEDQKEPGGELVIEISDNGEGMNERGLEAFFNLGDSTRVGDDGTKLEGSIGEKGHGTKTYFNSRQIEVYTATKDGKSIYAVMDEPLRDLLQLKPLEYLCDLNPNFHIQQGTQVIIRGFNQNVKRDFSHRILLDYMLWFTKFADFSWLFEVPEVQNRDESAHYKKGPRIYLHGLGYDGEWEEVGFGHYFPPECVKMSELKAKNTN